MQQQPKSIAFPLCWELPTSSSRKSLTQAPKTGRRAPATHPWTRVMSLPGLRGHPEALVQSEDAPGDAAPAAASPSPLRAEGSAPTGKMLRSTGRSKQCPRAPGSARDGAVVGVGVVFRMGRGEKVPKPERLSWSGVPGRAGGVGAGWAVRVVILLSVIFAFFFFSPTQLAIKLLRSCISSA